MPSKKPKELWSAPPHTLAKLAILKNYLQAYFAILGTRIAPTIEILYIDGFAGPNEYTDHPIGSPSTAIYAANEAIRNTADRWKAKGINCIFVDQEKWIVENCERKLAETARFERVRSSVVQGRFDQILPKIIETHREHFEGSSPLFVFADPFGPTGIPFASIQKILSSDSSELFLNFDSDGLIRILKAKKLGNADANLTSIFGDESWRGRLDVDGDSLTLARSALALFKQRLRRIPSVNYVFAFEMQKHAGTPDYHLVFASKERLGLEKMKEAMKSMGQSGFEFCDASVRTGSLFRFDRPEDWAGVVHGAFAGTQVPATVVWDFVLNETLLVNAKGVLKELEDREFVTIERETGVGKSRDLKAMRSISFKAARYTPLTAQLREKGLFDGP